MSKDGDRTGPDSPTESSREPDEFDSLVLDDHFIAGGIPEASLSDHQRSPQGQALRTALDMQQEAFVRCTFGKAAMAALTATPQHPRPLATLSALLDQRRQLH